MFDEIKNLSREGKGVDIVYSDHDRHRTQCDPERWLTLHNINRSHQKFIQQMDLKRVCDNGEQALCFSGGTPQILGYLTSNSYAAYLEMVQK